MVIIGYQDAIDEFLKRLQIAEAGSVSCRVYKEQQTVSRKRPGKLPALRIAAYDILFWMLQGSPNH
jgi:hypothetical protein